MVPISILLANEPRAYRDTIAVALHMLRPKINVIVTEPLDIDDQTLKNAPHLVICNHLTSVVEARVPTWIVLYPSGATGALLSTNGERTTLSELDLNGLIALIDTANAEAHAASSSPKKGESTLP